MIDIREGDILVVSGKDYPIRAVEEWEKELLFTRSFSRLATKTAATKRSPGVSSGKVGTAVTNLTGLACLPLDPVSAEVERRLALDTPFEILQTFVSDGTGFLHLYLEDLKK